MSSGWPAWVKVTVCADVVAVVVAGAAGVAGPGLLDMTRLAMSSYELWGDILETNAPAIGAALDAYIAKLQGLRANFEGEFKTGSSFAKALRAAK